MKYIKGLDTLRAFAILFVIVEHWWIPMDIDPHPDAVHWIKGLVPDGGFGVDLFFVLSGYLITSILLDALKKEKGANRGKILKNFIIRRILRIFPVYYLTIIILVIAGFPFEKDSLWWYLLYVSNMYVYWKQSWNNFSHTWSLAVEEQFYLIWPWLVVFIKQRFVKYVFFGAIAVGILTTVYTMRIQHNWAGFVLMPACMQAFGIGGLYAYLRTKERAVQLRFLRFLSFMLPVCLFFHFYWAFSPYHGEGYTHYFLTVNSLISIWLIHKVINNRSERARRFLLENPVLNKIGQISYGIYLFHYVLPFFYDKLIVALFHSNASLQADLLDWKNAYFLKLGLLFAVSLISFHFFEKPILRLKKYFEY